MVEAELALLEVEEEGVRVHAAEAGNALLGFSPEAFDAIDVAVTRPTAAELAPGVIDVQVLLAAHVENDLRSPSNRRNAQSNVRRLCRESPTIKVLRTVGDDFGVDHAVAFKDAKDDSLLRRAASYLVLDAGSSM